MDFEEKSAEEILMYSDASGSFLKGFGAWCQKSWLFSPWSYDFMVEHNPSIEYLQLYAVTVAVVM